MSDEPAPAPRENETEKERLDRNLMELRGELRIALPGVQVLFIAGLGALALAMTSVMLLIGDVLFGTAAVVVFTALAAGLLATLWALLPLRHRHLHG